MLPQMVLLECVVPEAFDAHAQHLLIKVFGSKVLQVWGKENRNEYNQRNTITTLSKTKQNSPNG